MILYQNKFDFDPQYPEFENNTVRWYTYQRPYSPEPEDLEVKNFKIDDVVYTEWSDAFKKALMWEQLTT